MGRTYNLSLSVEQRNGKTETRVIYVSMLANEI